jgi:hypothetical protein
VGHEVRTAFELGWHQLKDNVLLPKVAEQFDVLVTIDRGLEHEHNVKSLRLGIVIVHVTENKVEFYRSLAAELLTAVREVRAGTVRHVLAAE